MKKLIFIFLLGLCFTQTSSIDNNKSSSNISDKLNLIGIGLLTNKTFNLIQYTSDYKLSENYAFFVSLGVFSVGSGITWQSNYNANGMMISGGVAYAAIISGNLSLSYQWRLGKSSNFFSLGVNSSYFSEKLFFNDSQFGYSPVISFDRRF